MSLENCRIVLVRPRVAGNIGAAARVMRNMGLRDLVLVSPEAKPVARQARRMSTRGEQILHQCRVVETLGEALTDCLVVIGTSARAGGPFRRQSVVSPETILPRVVETLVDGPVALVFGPERTGLTNDEVTRCHFVVRLATEPDYRALNLAQSVAIITYLVRTAWLSRTPGERQGERLAPFKSQERMFASLQSALEAVHFLYGQSAATLMHSIRHLIGRAGPTQTEIDILLGLARQLRWVVDSGKADSPRGPVENSTVGSPEEASDIN
jgi:TrmH family RNA methyltransferase